MPSCVFWHLIRLNRQKIDREKSILRFFPKIGFWACGRSILGAEISKTRFKSNSWHRCHFFGDSFWLPLGSLCRLITTSYVFIWQFRDYLKHFYWFRILLTFLDHPHTSKTWCDGSVWKNIPRVGRKSPKIHHFFSNMSPLLQRVMVLQNFQKFSKLVEKC